MSFSEFGDVIMGFDYFCVYHIENTKQYNWKVRECNEASIMYITTS
jgi:hypothetical protein